MFAGDYRTVELPTLEVEVGGDEHVAVNDVVVASATLGRIVELGYAIGGEELGAQPCDGLICATPAGLDRLQPLERRAGARLGARRDGDHVRRAAHAARAAARRRRAASNSVITNRTPGVDAIVLVDGHPVGRARRTASRRSCASARSRSLLATLPEQTFFRRYGATFGAAETLRRAAGRTMDGRASPLRIENLVLIREAELELDARPERDHRRDRRGQDDLLERDRPAARRARRRGADRRRGREAYVEAEFDARDDEVLGAARRAPARGRGRRSCSRGGSSPTAARAPTRGAGRAAREDVAAAVEALLAMSGQFEQRRLARPAYQLACSTRSAGLDDSARVARRAWRELRPHGGRTTS